MSEARFRSGNRLDAGIANRPDPAGRPTGGGVGGNETRFINHSCRPNCVAVEAYDDADELIVEIRAMRRISEGDELFLDCALTVDESQQENYACLCNEVSCRGTMAAVEPA